MKLISSPESRLFPIAAIALGTLSAANFSPVQAQTSPATISFNVIARGESTDKKSPISQTMTGRVHVRGTQVRMESKAGQQNVVVLFLKPYVYRLLPSAKAGVRYKSSTLLPELHSLGALGPQLLSQPQKIKATLTQKGARRTGASTLNGTKVEVYEASRWNGQPRSLKLWLRASDSLPMRMISSANGMKVTVSWSHFQRGHSLSPALFTVPRDYRIREGQAPKSIL